MTSAPRFGWSENAARYYDRATGRFVSRDTIRLALDDVIDDIERRVREVSEQLRGGLIDLTDWQAAIRDEIKHSMLTAEALARGGKRELAAADYGRVGAAVRAQYRYLNNFTQQIRDGLPLDGRFLNRAAMYARAGRPFYHDEVSELLEESGYLLERNILHPADHCTECVDQSALGYVPMGTLIPPGQRECLANCRCTVRYR